MRRAACILASFSLLLAMQARALEVSRPEIVGPAPYTRNFHDLATNGRGYLVAWEDSRPGISTGRAVVHTVRGALLDESGHPTAVHDFPIASSSRLFAVRSNGSEYLVVTCDVQDGQWSSELQLNVVTTDGRVRASSRVRGQLASITGAGGDYYAVLARDGAMSIFVFDADARLLAQEIEIAGDAAVRYAVLFGTSDGRLLASWDPSAAATRVAFVSRAELAAGRFVTVSRPEPLWSDHAHPRAMLETARGYLLQWTNSGLETALLDRDGAVIENAHVAYKRFADFPELRDAVVFPTTSGLLAVDSKVTSAEGIGYPLWTGTATTRLDDTGRPAGDFQWIDDAADHVAGAPARGGGGVLTYRHVGTQQIRVRRVTPSGEIELGPGEVVATRSVPAQAYARIRRCGDTTIIAWVETTGAATQRVLYRRFDSALEPIDPPNVLAGTTTATDGISLACGATSALLIWPDGQTLHGLLFPSPNQPPRAVALGDTNVTRLRVPMTFDGTGYVIVRGAAIDRWSESGALLFSSPSAAQGLDRSAIGWNGSELLIAGEVPAKPWIVARRLNTGFLPIGPDIVVRSNFTWVPAIEVAAAGEMWLVGWSEDEPRTMRIDRSGTPLDPDGGVASGPRGTMRSVLWNGTAFEIVTDHEVTRRTLDGALKSFPLLDADAQLIDIEAEGDTPVVVYSRVDPVQEVRRLFAERIARRWSIRPGRTRTARH